MASHTIGLIHVGDFHGHLTPRAHCRADSSGEMRGGLARVFHIISDIRRRYPDCLLINTGDTVQGSAEVLFTRGQAIVDVLNAFDFHAFAPGNWDYVYGTDRFIELFGGEAPLAPWNALASNLYYSDEGAYREKAGQRVLPPYLIREIAGVRIGILGFTTDRGPQAMGDQATRGFKFTKGDAEAAEFIELLRTQEKVDVLIAISELGLANNVRIAEAHAGLDIILSSDMHEETRQPVRTSTGTLVVEEGQDGTVMGEFVLILEDKRLVDIQWQFHVVDSRIPEDLMIAAKVAEVRKSFVEGPDFVPHVNPFNGTRLQRPIDSVIGNTAIALHRANFSHEDMPAVIEGSSHDFLTDAFRVQCNADIGAIRGFRYGTHVPPGPIRLEDLYHFIPIGPQIAAGKIKGQQLKKQIENSADGALSPDITTWTGGWVFNFSGVTFDLDPYGSKGKRASDIRVGDRPLQEDAEYRYASYWYEREPTKINHIDATAVEVLKGESGEALDATEIVVRYLASLPDRTAYTRINRIRLTRPLPAPAFGNPEIQPLKGVPNKSDD